MADSAVVDSRRVRSSPRVKSGGQYRSERSLPAPADHNVPRGYPQVFRQRPGVGYRHVLLVRQVRAFLAILPEWPALAEGLNAVLLAPGRAGCDGFHRAGVVAVCAWPRNFSQVVADRGYVEEHRDVFERLGVPVEAGDSGCVLRFTEETLRAYQLLHVLLHELGHHHDRMTTRTRRRASRGEGFAEEYARAHGERIWGRYFEVFPRP